jgi:hypothetical protein
MFIMLLIKAVGMASNFTVMPQGYWWGSLSTLPV